MRGFGGFSAFAGLVVEHAPFPGALVAVEPVHPCRQTEGNAIDLERQFRFLRHEFRRLHAPAFRRAGRLPPCKGGEPRPQLLVLNFRGDRQPGAVLPQHQIVQRVAEAFGQFAGIGAIVPAGFAEAFQHVVRQRTEVARVEFVGGFGDGLQLLHMQQPKAVRARQVVLERRDPQAVQGRRDGERRGNRQRKIKVRRLLRQRLRWRRSVAAREEMADPCGLLWQWGLQRQPRGAERFAGRGMPAGDEPPLAGAGAQQRHLTSGNAERLGLVGHFQLAPQRNRQEGVAGRRRGQLPFVEPRDRGAGRPHQAQVRPVEQVARN